jgi:hypothetical protein
MIRPLFFFLASVYGTYCIYYGIRFGLVKKQLPHNYWRQTYYTGQAAVRQGWLYIIIVGAICLIILLLGYVRFGFWRS